MLTWMQENGWEIQGLTQSQIQGADGNVEFLVWLKPAETAAEHQEKAPTDWYDETVDCTTNAT